MRTRHAAKRRTKVAGKLYVPATFVTDQSGRAARRGYNVVMLKTAWRIALFAALLLGATRAWAVEPGAGRDAVRFRGPAALVVTADGQRVLTANRRSGTISIVDPAAQRVIGEMAVAKKLSSLVPVPDTSLLLATDEADHALILMSRRADDLKVVARAPVAQYPVNVVVDSAGKRCYVASLWSRRLSVVEIESAADRSASPSLKLLKVLPLSFAPRELVLFEPGPRLIIGDGFGGGLAIINTQWNEIEVVHDLPVHNIRGLAINAEGTRLLVAHQILNSLARTTPDDVHWGMLMGNVVRSLDLQKVIDPKSDPFRGSSVDPVGDAWKAGADPGPLALLPDGRTVVALAGVGEIGILRGYDSGLLRIPAGVRPTTLALSPDGNRIYVGDALADTVSVIDPQEGTRLHEISLGPRPELSSADRGERLFYSGELSHGGWMSCHSCHVDGHSNGLLNDNLGDGNFGAPKRVLSLLGVGRTGPWAWNGGVTNLEVQIKKSIETTMRGRPPAENQVRDLAAFLRTLPPPPVVQDSADRTVVARGRKVFESRRCSWCHSGPEYTSEETYDVGLKDELNESQFNPPSLRGVGHRDRLFHDNRAKSLEDVLQRFKHQVDAELPANELTDLIAFLRSL
ncbi:MAG: cytochrome C peroxidase [Planctomycetia bacterium]|nr:cytochrome C peroxidase [Planctomycetia bacterium]